MAGCFFVAHKTKIPLLWYINQPFFYLKILFWTDVSLNKEVLAENILYHYFAEAGYNKSNLESESVRAKYDGEDVAWVEDENKNRRIELYISPNRLGSILNNRFDFQSLLKHEWESHATRILRG